MDAKITKKRLGHQLSYDWIKIAGTCILAVVLLLVLFTTIATRPTAGQTFDFYTFFDVRFNSSRLGSLDTLKEKGALSYDIQNRVKKIIEKETGISVEAVNICIEGVEKSR